MVLDNLKRPVFTTTFSLGLILAVQIAQLPFGAGFLINVFASAIIVSWMLAALRLSTGVLDQLARSPRAALVEPRTIPLFDLVIKLGAILVASYSLLLVWGINPVGWLASAGIVGIAVGFAAKDTLANLFSGLFILADAPYKIGDFINLDTGERGEIVQIGMRSTRLLTRSDVEITVPNAVIANAKITNESGGPYEKMRSVCRWVPRTGQMSIRWCRSCTTWVSHILKPARTPSPACACGDSVLRASILSSCAGLKSPRTGVESRMRFTWPSTRPSLPRKLKSLTASTTSTSKKRPIHSADLH